MSDVRLAALRPSHAHTSLVVVQLRLHSVACVLSAYSSLAPHCFHMCFLLSCLQLADHVLAALTTKTAPAEAVDTLLGQNTNLGSLRTSSFWWRSRSSSRGLFHDCFSTSDKSTTPHTRVISRLPSFHTSAGDTDSQCSNKTECRRIF